MVLENLRSIADTEVSRSGANMLHMEANQVDAGVARALRAERGAAGLSREQLAKLSGVSVSTLRRIEEAERSAKVDQLAAICGALGLDLAHFFAQAAARSARLSEDDMKGIMLRELDKANPRPDVTKDADAS